MHAVQPVSHRLVWLERPAGVLLGPGPSGEVRDVLARNSLFLLAGEDGDVAGAFPLGGWDLTMRASAPRSALEPCTPAVLRVRLQTRLPAVLSSAAAASASAIRSGRIATAAWSPQLQLRSAARSGFGPGRPQ